MSPSPQVIRPATPLSTPLRTIVELTEAVEASPVESDHEPRSDRHQFDDLVVTGVEQRSHAVLPGDLFVAMAGAQAHGARFVGEAVAAGAVAVLTDAAGAELLAAEPLSVPVLVVSDPRALLGEVSAAVYGNPSRSLQVVGITGTSGKTTTSYLVEAGLTAAGKRTALIGTIETRIAGAHVPSALTTPEAPQLHAMFAVMVEQGVDVAVMEVSSHALALGRVDGVQFAVGAFTNLSQDHLDFHADFEDYYAAKRKLFDPASPIAAGTSVVCVDDAWGRRLVREVSGRSRVVTVATRSCPTEGPAPQWTAADAATASGGGQHFTAQGPTGPVPVGLRLPGRYNVANGLLALAVCATMAADPSVVAAALATVEVPGRMQRVDGGQDFLAVVDYAHKPAAVESVIATLREYTASTGGRLAVVVGAGGDRDTGKRPLMGATAARGCDLLVVTDDNPRSEDPAAIRAAIRAGAMGIAESERAEVIEIGDRAQAIAAAVAWARTGDVVLVAGKGHETGQEIAGVRHRFDDREVLAQALSQATSQSGATASPEESMENTKGLTVS